MNYRLHKLPYSIITISGGDFQWCYSAGELQERLRAVYGGRTLKKAYGTLYGYLDTLAPRKGVVDYSYMGGSVLLLFGSVAVELLIHGEGLLQYRELAMRDVKIRNTRDYPPHDMSANDGRYFYDLCNEFDFPYEGETVTDIVVDCIDSYPFSIRGMDEALASKAAEDGTLPNDVYFRLASGVDFSICADPLENFYIQLSPFAPEERRTLTFHDSRFEAIVRKQLQIYDRPLTARDALALQQLDCSDFTFDERDRDTLCAFQNVTSLAINLLTEDLAFLCALKKLEQLDIEFYCTDFDSTYLAPLQNLRCLWVSGGIMSDFTFHNFEVLATLPLLESVVLHEFGQVDLAALQYMPQLEEFGCEYGNDVQNIEAVAYLTDLKELTLIYITAASLDFLDTLHDSLSLTLCSVHVTNTVDKKKLYRFREHDLDDVTANGVRIV